MVENKKKYTDLSLRLICQKEMQKGKSKEKVW